jgi:hypothetical protein
MSKSVPVVRSVSVSSVNGGALLGCRFPVHDFMIESYVCVAVYRLPRPRECFRYLLNISFLYQNLGNQTNQRVELKTISQQHDVISMLSILTIA